MPRKRAVPTLEEQALLIAVKLILDSAKNMARIFGVLIMLDPQLANSKISPITDEIKQLINSIALPHLTKLSLLCFEATKVNNAHKVYNVPYNYNELILRLAEALLTSGRVQKIVFQTYPLPAQSTLLKHLPCMHSLQVLSINHSDTIINRFPFFMDTLTKALFNMSDLKEFILHRYCTNDIIATIASSCKKIEKIDVYESKAITDVCISDLRLCVNLKNFQFYETAISKYGYEQLSFSHQGLEKFDLMFLLMKPNSFYKKYDEYKKRSKMFTDAGMLSVKILRELSDWRPNITCLSISYSHGHLYKTILSLFPNLTDIIVDGLDDQELMLLIDLCDALKVIGSNIRSLRFIYCTGYVMQYVNIIENCPNIESTSFYRCLAEGSEEHKITITPLPLLKELYIKGIGCMNIFQVLCSYSPNINSIFLFQADLDDEIMHDILVANPMKQLERLMVHHEVDSSCTMSTVKLLMENCDNLWYLPCLTEWVEFSTERNIFKKSLKLNNIDLVTSCEHMDENSILCTTLRSNESYYPYVWHQ